MTELSSFFQSFVDQPLARPPSIDSLVARRQSRRRLTFACAVAVIVAASVTVTTGVILLREEPAGVEINVAGPGRRSAAYIAVVPGGYEASGAWRLTIIRHGERILYTSATAPSCGPTGTIQPGDAVYGETETADSLLRAGEDAGC